jgi:eukaryotic-like serine/threonine-protein kinase
MGVVYRARDRERGVDVALKTLRGMTPESVLRFKTEFRALRDLRHPNLVELGELFETDGTWFFTMELVRGVPFLQWLRGTVDPSAPSSSADRDPTSVDAPASVVERNAAARQRRIARLPSPCCDVTRLRTALGGLARGLSVLHAAGNVHRDIKPSNILVEDNGRVVLVDFGVVAQQRQQHEPMLMGTLKYMAPEQARGEPVSPAADWYAVGVLLFQALTGELPFGNVSPDELLVLKQHVVAPLASELVDGIPPDLDLLTQGLLERDASARPTEPEIFEALGIISDDTPPVPLPAHDQLFVGRKAELATLDEALTASRTKLATVIVEGESGVGKSAVVGRFVDLARVRDPRLVVLHGRCHERERVPFNALDGVLDDLARFLVTQREARLERLVPNGVGALLTVFPALRAVRVLADAAAHDRPVANVRSRAFAALRELLVRLCRRRATVITIEDLQWADADSTALLAELTRTDDEAPRLCLVATKRTHESTAIAGKLGPVQTLAIAGLDAADTEELVRRVSTDANPAQIIAETHGHPLFVRELARQRTTMRLDDAIWTRASRLDEAAQRLLAAVAVAGSPIPRTIAFTMTNLRVTEADVHVAALTRESLVRVHGPRPADAIEPFHDRIREAVLAHQPLERQRELHHALARGLEAIGAPPAQLLSRFEAAGDSERAAHYVVPAAEAARAAFAFGRAAELFRRALEAPGLANDRRSWLLVQLADSLANDGRTAEAAERFLEAAALEEPDSDRQLDLLRRGAERFLMSGRLEQGLETTRAVLERAGMTLPSSRARTVAGLVWNQLRMRGSALHWTSSRASSPRSLDADICWSIGAGLGMVDSLLGAYFSGRAARLALARGNALQICRGMAAATVGACLLGRRDRARRLMACAERAGVEDGSPLAQWYIDLGRTSRWFLLDNDFARAHRAAVELEQDWYAAGQGPGWETDIAMHFSLASQQMLGELRELRGRVAELAHNAKRTGDLFQEVTLRVRFAVRHLVEDRPDDARADVLDAIAAWLPGADAFGNQRAWALWSRTRISLYQGRLDDDLESEWQRMLRSLVGRVPVLQAEYLHNYGIYLLARAYEAKRRGSPSTHAELCARVDRIADRLGRLSFPAAPAVEHILRAGVAWARGSRDRRELTRIALDQTIECGLLVYAAFLKRRLGEAIGGDEGATLTSQADALAMRSGWLVPERGAELAFPTGRFS